MDQSAFGVEHLVAKAGWDSYKHPRGGNKANPGQFSTGWGPKARKHNAAIYQQRAERRHARALQTGTRAEVKRYRFYALDQKKRSGRKLTAAETREHARLGNELVMADGRAKALTGAALATGAATYLATFTGGLVPAAVGAGTTLGLARAASRQVYAPAREELGITGFRRDGILSKEEQTAVNGLVLAGLVTGGVLLDSKLHANISGIAAQKIATRLGKTKVTRDLHVSDQATTKTWDAMMAPGHWIRRESLRAKDLPRGQVIDNPAAANWRQPPGFAGLLAVPPPARVRVGDAVDDAIRNANLDRKAAVNARIGESAGNLDSLYYGNPFQGGPSRIYHMVAAKRLGINEPLTGHYQLRGTTVATVSPAKLGDYIEETYQATQKLLKELGVTHVDVVRGMAVNERVVRNMRLPASVDGANPVWLRGDIRLQALNSFSTKPDMAIDYALNNVGGFGNWGSGNLAVIVRARVPAERVYSFAGFGPGHGSEIVIKGGWLNGAEMMVVDPAKALGRTQRLTGTLGRTTGRQSPTMARIRELWDANTGIAKRDYSQAQANWERRARRANRVENTGQTMAGTAGAALGGAALRDAAFKDYPGFKARSEARAAKLPKKIATPLVQGKPGFKVLATAAGGTVVAATGTRSKNIAERKARRYEAMSKSFGHEPGSLMHAHDVEIAKLYTEERAASPERVAAYGAKEVARHAAEMPKRKYLHPFKTAKTKKKVRRAEKYYSGKGPYTEFQTDEMTSSAVMRGRPGEVFPAKVLKPGEKGLLLKAAPMSNRELSNRKKIQAASTLTSSTLGLGALGALGGAKLLPKATKLGKTPRGQAYARHLDRAANNMSIGAAGLGGAGGYNFAMIQRAEANKVAKPVQPKRT